MGGHLESITHFLTIFAILLISYGATQSSSNVQTSLNNLFGPWPSFGNTFQLQNCDWWNAVCATQNLQTATAAIAISIDYPAVLFFTILGRVSAFLAAITGLFFGPEASVQAVPFLDLFFLGMLLIGGYELFRMARGNSSAGTL